jgi:uncharacterized membrane protein
MNTKLLNKNRLEALTDGIYAVLMTLLVLNIDVEKISSRVSEVGLNAALCDLRPELVGFVTSFLLIAILWIVHNKQFRHLVGIDQNLLWIGIFGLLFMTLMPFSTALMTQYDGYVVAVMVFHVNIFVVGLMNAWQWFYIAYHEGIAEKMD